MSPSAINSCITSDHFDADLNLSIVGLGVEYPPFSVGPEALETLANRFYPPSTALKKVLSINRFTGIDTRAAVGNFDHPLVNQPNPPTITELHEYFHTEGVRLSVNACKKAINEWGGNVDDITHVVSTTCTNSANPGFDHFVVKQLGIRSNVEKVLLHGIGCSGGLAAIRTASNLALGFSFRKKPARVLVIACELSTLLVRSELDSIHKNQEVRIGVCLFSDCASSVIISNGIDESNDSKPIYDLCGWKHEILEDTENDLGFDVDPLGWKVTLTPRVPALATAAVLPAFLDLINSLPTLHHTNPTNYTTTNHTTTNHTTTNHTTTNHTTTNYTTTNHTTTNHAPTPHSTPTDFDWALHPGGATILTGIEQAMNLTPDHLRASYDIYMNHGNSSSATIISVLHRLREIGAGREKVVACAFGPGISLEMMVLRKRTGMGMERLDGGEEIVGVGGG